MPDTHTFHFLELNPRLQVEHPVSEMISNVNLPSAQLQVAMGIPLHRNRDIRLLYRQDPRAADPIPFDAIHATTPAAKAEALAAAAARAAAGAAAVATTVAVEGEEGQAESGDAAAAEASSAVAADVVAAVPGRPVPHGHVIACRITAENPDEGFKPSGGRIDELTFRSSKNVWGYFSVVADGGIHEFADSQFGHVFAWGETRGSARRHMARALKELSIRGDFRTTTEYLSKLLETDVFLNNAYDTAWLDSLIAAHMQADTPPELLSVVCGALHLASARIEERFGDYTQALEKGQVMSTEFLQNSFNIELVLASTLYVVAVALTAPSEYTLLMNGTSTKVQLHKMADGGCLVIWDGASHTTYMKEKVDHYRLTIDGQTCLFTKDSDPTVLRSASPGKLVQYLVPDGGHVDAGDAFAEIEVATFVVAFFFMYQPASARVAHRVGLCARLDRSLLMELNPPPPHSLSIAAVAPSLPGHENVHALGGRRGWEPHAQEERGRRARGW